MINLGFWVAVLFYFAMCHDTQATPEGSNSQKGGFGSCQCKVSVCPRNFTPVWDSHMCIRLFKDRLMRAAANDFCEKLGRNYRLAVLNTDKKLRLLQEILLGTDLKRASWYNDCWIGGKQEDGEGRWLWSTGEEITQGWGDGEPSNYRGKEHCLGLSWFPTWTTWRLSDLNCNSTNFFICEYQQDK